MKINVLIKYRINYTKKYFDDVLPKITDSIGISMHHEIEIK